MSKLIFVTGNAMKKERCSGGVGGLWDRGGAARGGN